MLFQVYDVNGKRSCFLCLASFHQLSLSKFPHVPTQPLLEERRLGTHVFQIDTDAGSKKGLGRVREIALATAGAANPEGDSNGDYHCIQHDHRALY
jgi:hypothetical protein